MARARETSRNINQLLSLMAHQSSIAEEHKKH